ncbi:4-oxalocrotonate tautomerase family protein [Haloimpatiens sp. FM7330]|uniref:tautomerase family protein n=1 Tax=Haloimpatiens sp. FM7330 TaxID=3298610 RepID=UPI003626F548
MPFINIKMTKGRSLEQKRELVDGITKEIVRVLDVKPEWVTIVIDEYSRDNWASNGEIHSIKFGQGCGKQGTGEK